MKKLVVSLVAVVLAMGLTVTLTSPPATAAETTRQWDNKKELFPAGDRHGFAQTRLTVEWRSKRVVDIHGWIDDVCNYQGKGDGLAAFVKVWTIDDSPFQGIRNQRMYRNSLTCPKGQVDFDPPPFRAPRNGRPLRALTAMVCSYYYDGGYKYDTRQCDYERFANPYTRRR